MKVKVFVAQSCLTLCNPMDCNLPGSSVCGILQARILEWVAIPFSRRSSQPRNWTLVSCTASLVTQLVKNPLQCGRPGFDSWIGKIPWRSERLHTPVFWPGEFHRLYSPWGRKKSDRPEWLSLSLPPVQVSLYLLPCSRCFTSELQY